VCALHFTWRLLPSSQRCASRLTSSWSGRSYVGACAQQARHFIMRLLRAGQRSAPPLNCGVRRQQDRIGSTSRAFPGASPFVQLLGSMLTSQSACTSQQEQLRSRPASSTSSVANPSRWTRISSSHRAAGTGGNRNIRFSRRAGYAATSPVAQPCRSGGRAQCQCRSRHRAPSQNSFVSAGPFARLCSGSRVPRMGQGQLRVGVRMPPNQWLQLTVQLVTPLACARGAPSCPAAEPRC
jgi:hypothetical protein